MKCIEGGVCAAKGFKATGLNAGIKNNVKKDMALVFSEAPCVKAGTFTTNRVCAAPVKWDKKVVFESESAQAIVVNSGIANACTGDEGYEKCRCCACCEHGGYRKAASYGYYRKWNKAASGTAWGGSGRCSTGCGGYYDNGY